MAVKKNRWALPIFFTFVPSGRDAFRNRFINPLSEHIKTSTRKAAYFQCSKPAPAPPAEACRTARLWPICASHCRMSLLALGAATPCWQRRAIETKISSKRLMVPGTHEPSGGASRSPPLWPRFNTCPPYRRPAWRLFSSSPAFRRPSPRSSASGPRHSRHFAERIGPLWWDQSRRLQTNPRRFPFPH